MTSKKPLPLIALYGLLTVLLFFVAIGWGLVQAGPLSNEITPPPSATFTATPKPTPVTPTATATAIAPPTPYRVNVPVVMRDYAAATPKPTP
jgi:hypothetical protein